MIIEVASEGWIVEIQPNKSFTQAHHFKYDQKTIFTPTTSTNTHKRVYEDLGFGHRSNIFLASLLSSFLIH